jgi:hypothetical protein
MSFSKVNLIMGADGGVEAVNSLPPGIFEKNKIKNKRKYKHAVAWLVEALCYNREGRGFESR